MSSPKTPKSTKSPKSFTADEAARAFLQLHGEALSPSPSPRARRLLSTTPPQAGGSGVEMDDVEEAADFLFALKKVRD